MKKTVAFSIGTLDIGMGKPKEAAQLKRAAYRTSDFYAGMSKTDRCTAI